MKSISANESINSSLSIMANSVKPAEEKKKRGKFDEKLTAKGSHSFGYVMRKHIVGDPPCCP